MLRDFKKIRSCFSTQISEQAITLATPRHSRCRPATAPKNYVFIAFDKSTDNLVQQQWLLNYAESRPAVLRTYDLKTQGIAAFGDVGIATLPHYVALRGLDLQRLDVDSSMLANDIWLVVHNDLRHAPAVRAIMDFLVECFQSNQLASFIFP